MPLAVGIKNGAQFLAAFRDAVDAYAQKHRLSKDQMAIFEQVNDDAMSLTGGGAKVLPSGEDK